MAPRVVEEAEVGGPGQRLHGARHLAQPRGGRAALPRQMRVAVLRGVLVRAQVVAQQPQPLVPHLLGRRGQPGVARCGQPVKFLAGLLQHRGRGHQGVKGLVLQGGEAPHPGLQTLARGRDGGLPGLRVIGVVGEFQAGLRHGEQVRAEVAAVHRGHVARWQRLQRLGVVPVEEVAAVALHAVQGGQRGFEPREHVFGADPAEAPRAQGAEQVEPDVGG